MPRRRRAPRPPTRGSRRARVRSARGMRELPRNVVSSGAVVWIPHGALQGNSRPGPMPAITWKREGRRSLIRRSGPPPASSAKQAGFGELAPGRDAGLRVDLGEVVLDGATAEEELGGDLGVAVAVGGVLSDLELLGREVLSRPRGLVGWCSRRRRAARCALGRPRARRRSRSKVSMALRRCGRDSARWRERRSVSPSRSWIRARSSGRVSWSSARRASSKWRDRLVAGREQPAAPGQGGGGDREPAGLGPGLQPRDRRRTGLRPTRAGGGLHEVGGGPAQDAGVTVGARRDRLERGQCLGGPSGTELEQPEGPLGARR